jgi:hypothetical protein
VTGLCLGDSVCVIFFCMPVDVAEKFLSGPAVLMEVSATSK